MRILWEAAALDSAARYMADDPDGVETVFNAVDLLGEEPRPAGSSGSSSVRRVHVGRYRVVYEITDTDVLVLHLGRVS